jgi:hypothetical protein
MQRPALTKRWLLAALAPLLLTQWGCGGMAMQQGTMTASGADDAAEINAPLAVGGSIQPDIQMDLQGTASPTLRLVSAQPAVASAENGRIIGRAPGVTAILVTTKDGTVLDFYHLWVEAASRATLHRIQESGENMGEVMDGIDLLVGESVYLTPKVYFDAQELAGVVPGTWSVDPPVAAVLREGMTDRRRVVARKPGLGTLTVQFANVKVAVPIRVIENGPPPPVERVVPPVPPPPPPPDEPTSKKGGTL